MSEWKKVVEDGQIFWVHPVLGNVMKVSEKNYVSMFPKVLHFGAFQTPERAQMFLERTDWTARLSTFLEELNKEMVEQEKEFNAENEKKQLDWE